MVQAHACSHGVTKQVACQFINSPLLPVNNDGSIHKEGKPQCCNSGTAPQADPLRHFLTQHCAMDCRGTALTLLVRLPDAGPSHTEKKAHHRHIPSRQCCRSGARYEAGKAMAAEMLEIAGSTLSEPPTASRRMPLLQVHAALTVR